MISLPLSHLCVSIFLIPNSRYKEEVHKELEVDFLIFGKLIDATNNIKYSLPVFKENKKLAIRGIDWARGTGVVESIETNEQTIALATISQENTALSPIGSDKILPDFRTDWRKFQLAQAFAPAAEISKSDKYVNGKADALIARGKVPDKKISPGNLSEILVQSAAQNPKSVAAALYHPDVPGFARHWFALDIIAKLPNKQLEQLSKNDEGRTFLRTMCEIVEDEAPAELKNNLVAR